MVVLDASFVIAWAYKEAPHSLDAQIRRVAKDLACVPAHWSLEIANAMLNSVRAGRIDWRQRDELLNAIKLLPIEADTETWLRGWDDIPALAREHRLTAYDAAYLELAVRRQAPLATLDHDLARAARAAGVTLFE
ncbi:MAG TPA: type II toxin-antitoxin system VapC family toxin [Steroidobacteraceae bacterium]|jgi:predicted nucleic acid-binding protein